MRQLFAYPFRIFFLSAALLAALAARVAAALGLFGWQPTVIASALTWFMAFALYLWYYSAILWNPRPDGRPG
jgi:uncharacterized protein involved in response to NO